MAASEDHSSINCSWGDDNWQWLELLARSRSHHQSVYKHTKTSGNRADLHISHRCTVPTSQPYATFLFGEKVHAP